jgi:hypothetical protein
VHVFVDEKPTPSVSTFIHDPTVVERFRVPSGRLLFAGQECFIGAISVADHPHMGREVAVAPGEYQFTAYRVEAPEDYVDERFAQQATVDQRRAWSRGNSAVSWCVMGTLAALGLAYFTYLRTVSVVTALLPLVLAAVAWWAQARYRRGESYRAAERVFRTVEREVPSIVVMMRRHA